MNKKRAFTVAEMLVVLGIICMLFALATPPFIKNRQLMAEDQFWHALRQEWRNAQVEAQLNHRETTIKYEKQSRQIIFTRLGKQKMVAVPSTITVKPFGIIGMHGNGYVRPRTLAFYSAARHQRYLMKIQLAWGGYRLEKVAE